MSAFEARTGHGVLINTFFNDNDEPIVETPLNAVLSGARMGLDVLLLGDCLIETSRMEPGFLERLSKQREVSLKRACVEELNKICDPTHLATRLRTVGLQSRRYQAR